MIQVVEGFLGKTELFLVALDLRAQLAEFARTCGQPPDLVQHRTEEIEDPLPPVQLDLRLLGGGLLERDPGGDPVQVLPQLGQLLPKGFDPLSQFLPTPFPPWTAQLLLRRLELSLKLGDRPLNPQEDRLLLTDLRRELALSRTLGAPVGHGEEQSHQQHD